MTADRLAEIVAADARTPIYRDKFGGSYVLRADARKYGQRAIIHRRELFLELARRDPKILTTERISQCK